MRQIFTKIIVTDAGRRDAELNTAVTAAMEFATQDKRCGVLVTRHAPSKFTVTLTPNVPFGLIHECDLMARTPKK